MSTETNVEVTKPEEKKFNCPVCGWHEGIIKAPEADTLEYLRSILGNRPFTKQYSLYNGQIVLKVSALDMDAADRSNRFISKLMDDKLPKEIFDATSLKVRILNSVRALALAGAPEEVFEVPAGYTDAAAVDRLFADRFGSKNEMLMRSVAAVVNNFSSLLHLLVAEGFDKNFWKDAVPF